MLHQRPCSSESGASSTPRLSRFNSGCYGILGEVQSVEPGEDGGPTYRSDSGASPAFVITGAASGELRKRISALAASGCWALAVKAPAKKVICWTSFGSGPTKVMPRDVKFKLADLLESDLGLATCHHRGHRLAGWRPSYLSALARDLIGDAEFWESRRRQIGAAAAVRIGDRFCREQRISECVDRCRYPASRLPACTTMPINERASLDLAVGAHQSSLCELVGGAVIQDHDIRALAACQPRRGSLPGSRRATARAS